MIIILSPAKSLNFETQVPVQQHTIPQFMSQARKVMSQLSKATPAQLMKLMDISDKLAELNYQRHIQWQADAQPGIARQAIYAYDGDVYDGLQAYTLDQEQIDRAQRSIRILSGLYGVLRPLDLIMPYRLEMGTALKVGKAANLYKFWGTEVFKFLNAELEMHDTKVIVNLASTEYSKAALLPKMKNRVVTPIFKEIKGNKPQVVSFFAKKARGQMARFAILNELSDVEQLKNFDTDGYAFNQTLSNQNEWVFTRVSMNT